MAILLSRDAFRESVFKRDNHKCVFCDAPAQDAHHILERRLWPDGGYYLENGASVCGEHHLACERTEISVEDVREACGISKKVIPPHLYDDHIYDKWGNIVLANGRRLKGELFNDESVQKVLREGGVFHLFTNHVKYPRTYHLPWSEGLHDDDRMMPSLDGFLGREVVVTEKMDGENTSMYRDHIHARSVESKGHPSRDWVKQFWSRISGEIPEMWRICGENLYAKHSIEYGELPSFFLGFSIWNERNECLSWDETLEYFELFGITPVRELYRGPFEEKILRGLWDPKSWDKTEGYVCRVTNSFAYGEFRKVVGKFVRKDHVQTIKHWMYGQPIVNNKMRSK